MIQATSTHASMAPSGATAPNEPAPSDSSVHDPSFDELLALLLPTTIAAGAPPASGQPPTDGVVGATDPIGSVVVGAPGPPGFVAAEETVATATVPLVAGTVLDEPSPAAAVPASTADERLEAARLLTARALSDAAAAGDAGQPATTAPATPVARGEEATGASGGLDGVVPTAFPRGGLLDGAIAPTDARRRGDGGDDDAPVVTAPVAAGASTGTHAPARVSAVDPPLAPPAPRPVDQVLRVLVPVRLAADGAHELALELRPEGLGTLRLDVVVDDATVHVSMRAETDAARQLLSQSLPELRAGLADAGLVAGRVAIAVGGDAGRRHRPPAQGERRVPARADRSPIGIGDPAPAVARDGLDLFL